MAILSLKIDVKKIDKARLYVGAKATYLDATVLLKDNGEVDQYGNCGMIVQDVTKEERAAGKKGEILGNAKWIGKPPASATEPISVKAEAVDATDDLPF